jgi:hypothetical protein
MGRSQRHMLTEQGTTAAGETLAEGAIAPGLILLSEDGTRSVAEVPTYDAGGPLTGSPVMGEPPVDLIEPPVADVAPVLSSLNPNTAELGSADVTMHCIGSGFTESSVIMFAGQPEPIVFISDTDITTIVKPSLGWGVVTVQVTVKNDTAESEPQDFTFTEAVVPLKATKKKQGE